MLHFIVESAPTQLMPGPHVDVMGLAGIRLLPTLQFLQQERGRPLRVSFDHVAEGLRREPGVFWEPDGSFVWWRHEPPVRLQGQLADGVTNLQHVELSGTLTEDMFDRLVALCRDDPATNLVFQLVRAGVYVNEPSLRCLLRA
jgi:hypothetical protein